jgi:hypothetical protein
LRDLIKLDYFCHHRARRVPGFLQGLAVVEPPALRALRKSHPDSAYVPFSHRIEWEGVPAASHPSLEAVDRPIWLSFSYGDATQGYFFRPAIAELTPDGNAREVRAGLPLSVPPVSTAGESPRA